MSVMLGLSGCASRVVGFTPAQIAVLQQQGFSPSNGNWELGISDKVLFATNSDQIDPTTGLRIEMIGQALASVEISTLRVEGHTDNYGTDAYNNDLSLRRANAVADIFEKAGFLSNNILVLGLGKQDPVADNNTPEGQAENRRVSIIVPPDQ
jgi:outer membrane protein OmpA-like peptidoglycan-associated protein